MFWEKIIFNLLYKWKYLWALLRARLLSTSTPKEIKTITYVARTSDQHWIFGAKVRRLAKFSTLKATTYFHDRLRNLPETDGYFFVFISTFTEQCVTIRRFFIKEILLCIRIPILPFLFPKLM